MAPQKKLQTYTLDISLAFKYPSRKSEDGFFLKNSSHYFDGIPTFLQLMAAPKRRWFFTLHPQAQTFLRKKILDKKKLKRF